MKLENERKITTRNEKDEKRSQKIVSNNTKAKKTKTRRKL